LIHVLTAKVEATLKDYKYERKDALSQFEWACRDGKISLHAHFMDICFKHIRGMKYFVETLTKSWSKGIDLNVYHDQDPSLRMVHSIKGTDNVTELRIDNEKDVNLIHRIYNSLPSFSIRAPDDALLTCGPIGDLIGESNPKGDEPYKETHHSPHDLQNLLDAALDYCSSGIFKVAPNAMPGKENLISLRRLQPSDCPICHKEHEHFGQYVYIRTFKDHKTAVLGCYRYDKWRPDKRISKFFPIKTWPTFSLGDVKSKPKKFPKPFII
jgi:hypothetical protein